MWLTSSSIGRKLIMAITGACLVLFVTFHCLMNAVAIVYPAAYNVICEFLGANWYALVWLRFSLCTLSMPCGWHCKTARRVVTTVTMCRRSRLPLNGRRKICLCSVSWSWRSLSYTWSSSGQRCSFRKSVAWKVYFPRRWVLFSFKKLSHAYGLR